MNVWDFIKDIEPKTLVQPQAASRLQTTEVNTKHNSELYTSTSTDLKTQHQK